MVTDQEWHMSSPNTRNGAAGPAGRGSNVARVNDTAETAARKAAGRRGGRLPRGERREQLLEAASELFVDRGYHAAGRKILKVVPLPTFERTLRRPPCSEMMP